MIRHTCTTCGNESELAPALAGLTIACKNCFSWMQVPALLVPRSGTSGVEPAIQQSVTVSPPPGFKRDSAIQVVPESAIIDVQVPTSIQAGGPNLQIEKDIDISIKKEASFPDLFESFEKQREQDSVAWFANNAPASLI